MQTAREAAYEVLCLMEREGVYSTAILNDALQNIEDSRETSLAGALVSGVTERKMTLDYNLSLNLNKPIKKLKPQVLTILRIGAYQLLFMQKIPVSAAVNEAVKCAKKHGCDYACSLINAVLRKVSAAGAVYPDRESDETDFLCIFYSVPEWLVEKLCSEYGTEKTESILKNSIGRRPVYIRVNTLKTDENTLTESLVKDGVCVKTTKLENCLEVSETGDITRLSAYKKGLFHVQDMSSQICASVLDAKSGEKIIDACAAPGGKSFTSAQYMCNKGQIISCDIRPEKTEKIEKGAQRLGIDIISAVCTDASQLGSIVTDADRVIVDAPCSGFGVIGRKPEIKYKTQEEIGSLPELQLKILESASRCVKNGGTLVYSTCTLLREENQDVCERFLAENNSFIPDDSFVSEASLSEKYNLFLPQADAGDGFFTARFIRRQCEE